MGKERKRKYRITNIEFGTPKEKNTSIFNILNSMFDIFRFKINRKYAPKYN